MGLNADTAVAIGQEFTMPVRALDGIVARSLGWDRLSPGRLSPGRLS